MQKLRPVLVLVVLLSLLWLWPAAPPNGAPAGPPPGAVEQATLPGQPAPAGTASAPAGLPGFLPPEAQQTLALIAQDGPYPHRQDGQVFGNREGRLPPRPRGYYREFTVRTPGLSHRGPRRIVTGGQPPAEYWYTQDHYASFRRFEPPR